jgi:isocitrate dehydrogenase
MSLELEKLKLPETGDRVKVSDGQVNVPDEPVVVLLEGDGIARTVDDVPGITDAATRTLDAAVEQAYDGKRKIHWYNAHAGDAAREIYYPDISDDDLKQRTPEDQRRIYLPDDTLKVIEHFGIALKGPLTTPIGGGFRSINVGLRQIFDLYSCVRPVKYFKGTPAPNVNAPDVDIVTFRENVEDVYAGIEFEAGSEKAQRLQKFLVEELGSVFHPERVYGLGLKPMSEQGSKRLIRQAIQYALDHGYNTVTMMHKGNIMKYTEGAFRRWGYELAEEEFAGRVVAESEVADRNLESRVIINDRVADSMFQQIQLRPGDYGVIATSNLNGDYISDALAALVGGLGLAPGANIGDKCAIFEATHGTAPKYAGKDMANPGSLMLSGAMLLDYLGWNEAGDLVRAGIEKTISEAAELALGKQKRLPVTYDLARQFEGYTAADGVLSSQFANRVIEHIRE